MEFQFLHYMARAWYFTLCREKAEQVLYNLKRRENVRSLMADRIWTKSIIGSSRGRICCLNWGREIRPRSGLRKALCEAHPEELPFMRKKDEIEQHLREVAEYF